MRCPIRDGVIIDWEAMESVWDYAFKKCLNIQPEDHSVIMTEGALTPKQNREQITKIMFERFNVPCLYTSSQEVCALYASGKTSGLVLDSGDGVTHAAPIFEGYQIPYATQKMPMAGKELTEYLAQLLNEKGVALDTETCKNLKESSCYVVSDYSVAMQEAN